MTITNGAQVGVIDLVQAGLKAHPALGGLFDAQMTISGTGASSANRSAFFAFADMLLGMDDGVRVAVSVLDGGSLSVTGDLTLAHETGSEATMTVSGVRANGARAEVTVGTNLGTEQCNIGFDGNASLFVFAGGLVGCSQMRIGVLSGSTGYVLVSGQEQGFLSTLNSQGLLCVGGSSLCNSQETNVQGTLELDEPANVIIDRGTIIGNGGRIIGQGEIAPGVLGLGVMNGGTIDPGIGQAPNPLLPTQPPMTAPHAPLVVTPGTLVIAGSLTISPTATLVFDVIGTNSNQYDQLVINDAAALDGRLELRFSNGFAPQQGNVFSFMQAGSSSGTFNQVVITGLAPGFQYTIGATNGVITLTALNNGIPTTQAEHPLYLPLLMR
jgi:hypothetical protein